MTERTIQSILATTGLTEAELVDLLEGGTLPADREAALRASLAQHPEVAGFFAGIRADRSAMRTLDRAVCAPAGLLDAVEIRLEQEALRGLTEPAVAGTIPVAPPAIQVERRSPLLKLLENTFARRLAAAAGLALAIGVGVWGTYIGIQNWPHSGPGGSGTSSGSGTIATKTDDTKDLPDTSAAGTGETVIVSAEPAAPMFTVIAATSSIDGPGIAADGTVYSEPQLIDLAGAGRLAIVVSGDSHAMPDRIARMGSGMRDFRVASIAGDSVASAMPALAAAMDRESRIPRADWAESLRNPWGATAGAGVRPASRQQLLSVVSPSDPAKLRSLLEACGVMGEGSRMPGRTVRIIVLDEPIEQPPELDAASVLWWSASPAKWVRTTTVPVIIEE
jgi:hypothetical protein